MAVVVTEKMLDAGYELCHEAASKEGYGWALNIVSENEVKEGLKKLYEVMTESAPKPAANG